ncbi:MAG: hypothetical protein ACTHJ5_06845 [Ilyomonas sp.]
MQNTNVKLSENELALVTNASFILTKNRIIEKVYLLFGELSEAYKELVAEINNTFTLEVSSISPKIYKGEQYEGLPYVMLDHPRYFTKEAVCAVRSLFWWGNFFSINLHISGKYQADFLTAIPKKKSGMDNWLFDTGEDEWSHRLDKKELFSAVLKKYSMEDLSKRKYIKLSKKIPLEKWDNAFDFFIENYKEILMMQG